MQFEVGNVPTTVCHFCYGRTKNHIKRNCWPQWNIWQDVVYHYFSE